MFENNLQSITGITIYPLFSLVVFVAFFTALIIYLMKVDKSHLEELSNIPLESSNETNQ